MEDQNQGQDQYQQNQEGEELLKMIGVEEEGTGGEQKEEEGNRDVTASGSLLSLTEISRQTGIMYVTLKRYDVIHANTDLKGLWEGEGRSKKYYPEAVEVFRRLKAESKKGRPRGGAPSGTLDRGSVVVDPLPPSLTPKKGGKKGGKKGAGKRPGKPSAARGGAVSESAPISTSLATQEADRAMAAIERVQLMARYEAVKEMVGQWGKEMERLEKVLGLGGGA